MCLCERGAVQTSTSPCVTINDMYIAPLPLSKAQHKAGELVVRERIAVRHGILANRLVHLFLRRVDAVVFEAHVELLEHVHRHSPGMLGVEGVKEVLDAVVRHREAADVVLHLLVTEMAVVVVTGDEARLHGFLFGDSSN